MRMCSGREHVKTTRLWALVGAAGLAISFTAAAAGTAEGATSATPASSTNPSFSKLSTSQVKSLSSGKQERMVVVFDDQLTSLPATKAHRQARQAAATALQAPLVAQLKQVGATSITTLSLINAVAAAMPAAEAQALSHAQGVKEVVPDGTIIIGDATSTTPTVSASRVRKPAAPASAADGQQLCSTPSGAPLVEPEALTSIHDASSNPNAADEASAVATGQGVIVGNVDANSLAGNPNLIRPDGQHVVIDAPNPNENVFSDEFNGDVSTIAAQGTVTYTYASQLPYANIPAGCSFRIVGDATGASLLSTGYFSDTNSAGQTGAPTSCRSPTASARSPAPTTTCSSPPTTRWCRRAWSLSRARATAARPARSRPRPMTPTSSTSAGPTTSGSSPRRTATPRAGRTTT